MLLRFSCENFLSFGDRVDFHLTAVPEETSHPHHLRRPVESRKEQALRVAAIYGANASGKTNLVRALQFARDFIVSGSQPNRPIPGLAPFKLREGAEEHPSQFELVVSVEGRLYEYGFVVTRDAVVEEWLYDQTDEAKEEMLFERATQGHGDDRKVVVEFGPCLTSERADESSFLEFVARGTRPNQLFFREGVERDVKEFSPLYKWLDAKLVFITPHSPSVSTLKEYQGVFAKRIENDPSFRDFAQGFLNHADTGIVEIGVMKDPQRDRPFPPMEFFMEMLYKQFVIAEGPSDLVPVFYRNVGGDSDKKVGFLLHSESAGTQRLVDFLFPLFAAASEEVTLIVDELDSSLHPLLTRQIIDFFLSHTQSNSQLIFTTHETGLLDLDLLRRDEIWFVEKDKAQSSRLYSLVEFKPRKDLRIDKGYLHGRFGAIPFLGDPSWLEMCENPTDNESPEAHK